MSKIFDCFLFYNEVDLLEIRLAYLYEHVDFFIIIEAKKTFNNTPKKLIYPLVRDRFKKYNDKVIYFSLDSLPSTFDIQGYTDLNKSYQHKHNGKPAKLLTSTLRREIFQRDSIIIPLSKIAKKHDYVLIGDLDEIPNVAAIKKSIKALNNFEICHFKMSWHLYALNNILDKKWFGTRMVRYSFLINHSVDYCRFPLEDEYMLNVGVVIELGGWHFSFIGDENFIKNKLKAYNYQSSRLAFFYKLIEFIYPGFVAYRIKKNKHFLFKDVNLNFVDPKAYFPYSLYKIISQHKNLLVNDY